MGEIRSVESVSSGVGHEVAGGALVAVSCHGLNSHCLLDLVWQVSLQHRKCFIRRRVAYDGCRVASDAFDGGRGGGLRGCADGLAGCGVTGVRSSVGSSVQKSMMSCWLRCRGRIGCAGSGAHE